jgi:hypothetical protein
VRGGVEPNLHLADHQAVASLSDILGRIGGLHVWVTGQPRHDAVARQQHVDERSQRPARHLGFGGACEAVEVLLKIASGEGKLGAFRQPTVGLPTAAMEHVVGLPLPDAAKELRPAKRKEQCIQQRVGRPVLERRCEQRYCLRAGLLIHATVAAASAGLLGQQLAHAQRCEEQQCAEGAEQHARHPAGCALGRAWEVTAAATYACPASYDSKLSKQCPGLPARKKEKGIWHHCACGARAHELPAPRRCWLTFSRRIL